MKQSPPGFQVQPKSTNFEEVVTIKYKAEIEQRMQHQEIIMKNQEAIMKNPSIGNLEIQIGQLAKIVSHRLQGSLPNDTKKNPIEHVTAISMVSEQHGEEAIEDKVDEPVSQVVDSVPNSEKVKSSPTIRSKSSGLNVLDSKLRKHLPTLPYPQQVIQDKLKRKFEKIKDVHKNLKIDIPQLKSLRE